MGKDCVGWEDRREVLCLLVMARQRRSGDLEQRGQLMAWAIRFTLGPLLQLTELILKAFGGPCPTN